MLEKIISIRNVGKFAEYQCQGDVELRRVNIVYADNGRGKTTLATILRSLKLGDGSLIEGRRTLGTSGEPEVRLLFDGSTTVFERGKWSAGIADLEVFDESFIAENVYSGNQVGHSQKRNLYGFVIGSRGVKLARKVDHLDEENRAKANELRNLETQLRRFIPGSIEVSDFVGLQPPPEGAIAVKEKEIVALETAEEIAAKSVLRRISLPEIPLTELKKLLSRSVASVSQEAAQRVQEHIAHCMDEHGESWIESGLSYTEDNNCPFCGQSLADNDLVKAYRVYFDEAYQSLKNDIDQFSKCIHQLLSENGILGLQREVASNDELIEFWRNHAKGGYPGIEFEKAIQRPWQDLRRSLARILEQKAAAPLVQLEPDGALTTAIEAYQARSRAAVADYNQTLDKINEFIEKKKEDTRAGSLEQARKELESLKVQRERHRPEVDTLCQDYERLLGEKKALERDKEQAKDNLDTYADEIIADYGPSLNDHLARCGAGFRIVELGKNYMGGKPRTDYCLEVDGRCVDLGGEDTPACEPSFRNTLSSGDKSALAFAFFITRLKQDPDLDKRIVVVDDPASSLDAQRRCYTCSQIAWLGNHCKQVIVLTHSAQLARQVWDSAKRISSPKTLWIRREGDYSIIDNDNIVERTQGEYFKNYFDICKYLEGGPEDDRHMRSVARCIRPVLEGYLRVRFPQEFGAHQQLRNFIKKLADAGTGDALYPFKPQLSEISEINDYSSKYHHDQNPNADSESIDDGELSAWAQRTLDFISQVQGPALARDLR